MKSDQINPNTNREWMNHLGGERSLGLNHLDIFFFKNNFLFNTATKYARKGKAVNASFPTRFATSILIRSERCTQDTWLILLDRTTQFVSWDDSFIVVDSRSSSTFCNLGRNGSFFSPVVHVFGGRSRFLGYVFFDCHCDAVVAVAAVVVLYK